jgi:eight-cysteine-cluster-containing protein
MRYLVFFLLLILICGCTSRELARTGGAGDRDLLIGVALPILDRPDKEGFCGRSTYGYCLADSDCIRGGCSDRICQSKNEMILITTCEEKGCYNADAYDLNCECINYKCQWTK